MDVKPNKQDLDFLKRNTAGLTKVAKKKIWEMYQRVWLSAAESEPVAWKKENKGRFAANTWLRNIS